MTWVTVSVGCDGGPGGYSCPGSQGPLPEAEADILGADFVINSAATPSASGFTGSLADRYRTRHGKPSVHGVRPRRSRRLQRHRNDRRQRRIRRDTGRNGGACQTVGTYSDGSLEFEQLLPCSQQVAVDIPVDTTSLTDGQHDLKVIVTDAAQNSSTVLDQTITTQNSTTVSSLLPSPPAASAAPVYSLALNTATERLTRGVQRLYNRSRSGSRHAREHSRASPHPACR